MLAQIKPKSNKNLGIVTALLRWPEGIDNSITSQSIAHLLATGHIIAKILHTIIDLWDRVSEALSSGLAPFMRNVQFNNLIGSIGFC
jgi:hypothetical protein